MTTPTLFRHHDEMPNPTHQSSPLITALLHEWVELNTSRPAAITVQRWARQQPVLNGATRPADIVDAAENPASRDAIMLALIRLTKAGEHLAGRILLQQMMPALVNIGRRHHVADSAAETRTWNQNRDDRQIIIATFWEVISNYPDDRRTTKIAANLALDTLLQVSRIIDRHLHEIPSDKIAHYSPNPPPERLRETADTELPELLRGAIATGTLTADAADMLHSIYGLRESPRDYSQRTGLTYDTVRQRCTRAKRVLQQAAVAEPVTLAS